MTYVFSQEDGEANHKELMPLYTEHYAEMQNRLREDGIDTPDFNPRLEDYFNSFRSGVLLNFVVRLEGRVVGYSNIYVTYNMHNSEMIAQEDTIFIVKEHRNGVGKALVKHILEHLKQLGVKRVFITPVTDLRVAKIWQRMGFKPTAQLMTYTF